MTHSQEAQLVLLCARVTHGDAERAQLQALLQADLDWRFVRLMARRNRVVTLLYRHLRPLLAAELWEGQLKRIEAHARWTVFSNMRQVRSLLEVLALLQAAGISAIPYKGPLLAQAVYQDVTLRQFGDLDLIVPTADATAARDLLLRHGFTQTWPETSMSPAQEAHHVRTKYNYTLTRAEDDLEIELHWSVTNRYINLPPDPADLWRRFLPVAMGGQTVHSFAPEELLIVLCAHGSNHAWNRLIWVCDVAEAVRTYQADLDWERLMALATSWNGRRMLFIGLYLAHELLDAALPTAVWQRVTADKTAVALAAQSMAWLLARDLVPFRPLEEPWYHMRMIDGWRGRLRYAAEVVRPSTKDWAFVSLPSWLAWLYFLIRPYRLLLEHGLNLLPGRASGGADAEAEPAEE